MKHINVMSKQMANLIAAGEVVERPASIVKELAENSIDAGATKLTVEIKNGGKSYIRVSDNGSGISKEDLPLAFVSHATSKISTGEDLSRIETLGFRGEALASICAVSRVEVLTCAKEENIGTSFVIEAGKTLSVSEAGCPKGTTMVVRDVFYNTPARMKFLKKDVSEANQIAAVVDKIALSHPEVAVTFIREGKQVLNTPGDGKLKNTVFSIFGRDFYSSLIDVDYTLGNIRVWGYISKPTACKPNRSMQYFFVSGRQVKSATAMAALDEAYKNSIMVGKVPACVLHIEVPAQFVDVNVHPAKIEVRFQNDKSVYDAVYYAAKNALISGDRPKQIDFEAKKQAQAAQIFRKQHHQQLDFGTVSSEKSESKKQDFWQHISAVKSDSIAKSPAFEYEIDEEKSIVKQSVLQAVASADKSDEGKSKLRSANEPVSDLTDCEEQPPKPVTADVYQKHSESICSDNSKTDVSAVRVVGEIFKTYIIAELGSEVLFIDKHAAHERMIFEQLKSEEHEGTQMLMEPVMVTLSKDCYQAVLDKSDTLKQAGFIVEDFGSGTLRVPGYPLVMDSMDVASAVEEIAGYLRDNKNDITPKFLDWVYHNVACRAAVKAGNNLSAAEMESFVKELLSKPDIRYCPHGRPVMVSMTKYSFEKQFGRIQ